MIASALDEKGLTLAEASARTGIPVPTLHSYKSGRIRGRNPATLLRLAAGLGLDPDALIAAGTSDREADEETLLGLYRRLSARDRRVALATMRALTTEARRAGVRASGG
jgi:transcriptional regulator with XRE-family HTH domain